MAHDDFNPDAYKCLKVIGTTGSIEVGVWQYKEYAPKIKVRRCGKRKDGGDYWKDAGGLTADEAEGAAPLMLEAAMALRVLAS